MSIALPQVAIVIPEPLDEGFVKKGQEELDEDVLSRDFFAENVRASMPAPEDPGKTNQSL